jgi:glycosyltransferase involved in cell wall biosynthesis
MRAADQGAPSPPDTLSIAHVCAPARVGGLERVVQGLARGQRARGHRVCVVAVVEPGADLEPFLGPLIAAGVEVQQVPVQGRRYIHERRAVRHFLESWRPDVLHTHGYRSDVLNGGMARRKGIATVSTLHGSSRMGGLSHLFEWIQERALRRFDGVVAVSRPLHAELLEKGVLPERLHLVPNAWQPLSPFLSRAQARVALGVPTTGLRIGWVGRLIPIKGPDVFAEAVARLGSAGDWSASMIGDGPERERIEELVRTHGANGRLILHGAVPDAERLFSAFDVLVVSSRSEGTPMVLFEAMANGVPIVAAAVGGVPDVVGDGAGWLAPSEDPAALAAVLEEAISDPAERGRRAARARSRLDEEYGPDLWLDRHDTVYRAALRATGRRFPNGHG